MPWLPPGAPHNILGSIPAQDWSDLMDGRDLPDNGPHTIAPIEYACTVKEDFYIDGTSTQFRAGMQGHCLEQRKSKDGVFAKIFIQGVTEFLYKGTWMRNQWVSVRYLVKNQPWKPDVKDWNIEARLSVLKIDSSKWNRDMYDTSCLGKTIHALVTAFHQSPADWMGEKISDFFKKRSVKNITATIIQGIQRAGLYNVLNKPNFTIQDLSNAAKYIISASTSLNMYAGVYFRYHISGSGVTRWKKNTRIIYIGKAIDMAGRYTSHKSGQTMYGDLTRNSSTLIMAVICLLDKGEDPGIFYIAEQVMVCLLQTYRPELRNTLLSSKDTTSKEHVAAIQFVAYFEGVAKTAFAVAGWSGGVARSSFEVAQGANYSSPLVEFSSQQDKLLWIRTDTLIKDKSTLKSVPTAFFRRATPKITTGHIEGAGKVVAMVVFHGAGMQIAARRPIGHDGSTFPQPGTPFYVVFEVRKDGLPHPQGWARLPTIGRFANWAQANSVAVRVDWEHPAHSGKWRHTYIQAKDILSKAKNCENVPGALKTYVRAITLIQWLFKAPPNHNHTWMPSTLGCARVLQSIYNLAEQSIVFQVPVGDFKMVSGRILGADEIKTMMKKPELMLQGVDGPFGSFPGISQKTGARTNCDACSLRASLAGANYQGKCVQKGTSKVCTNCDALGLPCCSWTPGLRPKRFILNQGISHLAKEKGKVTTEDSDLFYAIRAALFRQPRVVPDEFLQGFENVMHPLKESELPEDDVSDDEEDDEDKILENDDVSDGDGDI